MADIDLKAATPDTSLPTTGFLFGADSQAASAPSVYSTQTVATTLLGSTSLTGATITADAPVLNMSQTWNASGVTFTGLRFNAAGTSDANSAAASLLMDLQVNTASRFNVSKAGRISGATGVYAPYVDLGGPTNGPVQIGRADNGNILGIGYGNTGALTLRSDAAFGWSNSSTVTGASLDPATILSRRGPANLRLGAADTSASATITVTIAAPGVVTWSDHSLSTGSPVIFTTTGALPTGITADTTYYAIVVSANTFQLASSFANALAGTAITTSGSQSGTHTGRRGAIAQQFGPQDTLSTGSLENINGADFVIRGSRSIGNKPGGSIIFQVAPAGSSGTAQNALVDALTIDSTRKLTLVDGTNNSPVIGFASNSATSGFYRLATNGFAWSLNGNQWFYVNQTAWGIFRNDVPLVFGSGSDLFIHRDAANTLALRNGANAQAFRVYNTYTSATDFERGNIFWDSNVLKIGTEKGSAGGTARALEFQTDGTTRLTIGTTGVVTIASAVSNPFQVISSTSGFYGPLIQNTGSTTTSSAGFTVQNNQTSQLFARVYGSGVSASVWGVTLSSFSALFSDGASSEGLLIGTLTADPIIFGTDTSEKMRITSAGLLTFQGTTSSFPALKRSSASLQVRLADDTGYTTIDANHRLQGTAPAANNSTGTAGDIRYDADYIYICTATDTWKRVAIATWP